MAQTQPARGMRDFLPDDVRRREHVIRTIKTVYERYGFEPLETPAVENIDTLLGKYGEEGNQLIFRVQARGHEFRRQLDKALSGPAAADATPEARAALARELERSLADLALRYDLTVPLARVVAEHRGTLPRFFKRYQIQPVWRADRPARGRFREFFQCDVDALGVHSMVVEAELCGAVSDALTALGFHDFEIRLNHRQALSGLLESAGVPEPLHGAALVALDKLDKIGRDGVRDELVLRGVSPEAAGRLLEIMERAGSGGPADANRALDALEAFVGDHADGRCGANELRQVVAFAADTAAAGRLRVDPSLARGLSYYTGAIMEIAVPDLAGSLGGGGRYDRLVGMFLGEDVPACGFSLGLERIIVVMTERQMFPPGVVAAPADLMVVLWNAERAGASLALARDLRREGFRVEVYPWPDRIGRQFKYAADRGVPAAAVLGEEELASGEVSLKALRTGEQTRVPRADVADRLRQILAAV